MSQVLSYNNKTTKTSAQDWIPVAPYVEDDIKQIKDPNGGMSENPRTAIPSPFAQLDLVKNAFEHLASNARLAGSMMDKRLVSNALDVAQLFFDFENHKDYLHIVRWNRDEQIERLKSEPEHRLYGETLELFLTSDTKYNFNLLTDWYILLWNSQVIGATSPSSMTIAVPRESEEPITSIKVEQGISLFDSETRDLWQRDEDFVYYMFMLFNAFPTLRTAVKGVYDYMLKNKDIIMQQKPLLYNRLTQVVPNLEALSYELAPRLVERLDLEFDPFVGDDEVTVLGARLYHKRARDIKTSAASSDFVIAPTRQVEGTLPLVLRNNFNGSVDHYIYIDKEWDSSTQVYVGNTPINKRKLPDTSIIYPFITTGDFLQDTLIRLAGPIDDAHYFNGNVINKTVASRNGYLLPLTEEFFKYFNASDVTKQVCGRDMLEMEELIDGSVNVTLRVPLKKRYIELTRNYYPIDDPSWQFDEKRGTGRIITNVIMSAAIFPFVRTNYKDDYTVQLFTMIDGGNASLEFLQNGMATSDLKVSGKTRSEGTYSTKYYDLEGSFDIVKANVTTPSGNFSGYIVPLWKPYVASSKELIFAVDFGTTNSHVEWSERGHDAKDLEFAHSDRQVLIASLLKRGTLLFADQLQRVEFLPSDIDNVYGFPLRSALARNDISTGGHKLFADVNIPFLYERQYFDGYDITTNLKWMGDITLSREFLRELVLLIKAKVLLENGDLSRTNIVYFFPVSMGGSDRRKLDDTWLELYHTYFGDETESHLHAYPESIAPAYFYKGDDVSGGSFVSIDIGGGTTDTVIYQPTANRLDTEPVAISSFRFAGDAIFGDAFTERDADNNPLIKHYGEYFKRLISKNSDIGYLNSILQDVLKRKRSQDVNAFLFSIENVEQLRNLREVDRNIYSYNTLLRNDSQRKLIFMYFYAAIIYYIAQSMKARNYEMPKQIYFSGTGSKILNILGSKEQVTEFTRLILERVFEQEYTERFSIKIEHKSPKQITCRGGINLETLRMDGNVDVQRLTPRNVNAMKYCYSMLNEKPLTIKSVYEIEVRDQLIEQVEKFNQFFVGLCDSVIKDEFGIDNKVFRIFNNVLNDNISNYLTAGIGNYLKGRYTGDEAIEDVPFFYPIIGIIRHNLLKNLCNEVISSTV